LTVDKVVAMKKWRFLPALYSQHTQKMQKTNKE